MLKMSEFEVLTLQQESRNFYLAIIVAIITFFSALLIYIDYRNRKKKEKAEKSIEIAKEFAKDIIGPISVLYAFFESFEIDKIINKVKFLHFEDFDLEELKSHYHEIDIIEYKKLMDQNDPEHEIRCISRDILNSLEYLCMYIATNVADGKYIYNSLHQQFFKTISLLYFEISLINTDNKDKYFTNIIHVYNQWKKKYLKDIKNEEKFKKKKKKMKMKFLPSTPKI